MNIDIKFDGDEVDIEWFDPELSDVICELCGKRCDIKCVNANPWCG